MYWKTLEEFSRTALSFFVSDKTPLCHPALQPDSYLMLSNRYDQGAVKFFTAHVHNLLVEGRHMQDEEIASLEDI